MKWTKGDLLDAWNEWFFVNRNTFSINRLRNMDIKNTTDYKANGEKHLLGKGITVMFSVDKSLCCSVYIQKK